MARAFLNHRMGPAAASSSGGRPAAATHPAASLYGLVQTAMKRSESA